MEGLVQALQLVRKDDSGIVVRIMVKEPGDNPRAFKEDFAFLRNVCKTYSEFPLSDRTAVNCVTCGRGACHWRINIPGRREFTIFTMLADESEQSGPEDGAFPILSIIRSFQIGTETMP